MIFDLTSLLGKKLDEVADSPFIKSLNETPATRLSRDTFYMTLPKSGISLVATFDGRVSSVQLYNKGFDKRYKQFQGELPEGVKFTDSRESIRNSLKEPTAFSEGGEKSILGITPPTDRFDRKEYSLHLQYTKDKKSIALVSLIRPDAVRR